MDIFSFFTLFGGLAFFLFGMNTMSSGLEQMAGGKLEHTLKRVTSSKWLSMLLGAGITIAIQSSSALTVMLVGLVNSGIMHFGQTIGIIMGSNIGTTLTAWILSLAGIQSDNLFINLLKPSSFAPLFAVIGIALIMSCRDHKKRNIGNILLGFSILMSGMTLMANAMEPVSEMPEFVNLLTAFSNPLLAVLFGALFTGIIQSSAASVGILQALSITGSITYGMAIPIIMGQNIGTCVTALISSIGVSRNAKKVSVVHFSFNIIGTLVCLALFYASNAIFNFSFINATVSPFMIAVIHSIFNIFTTFLLLPFTKQLEKLANLIISEKETAEPITLLDERLLTVPSVAVSKAFDMTVEMADISRSAFCNAMGLLENFDETVAKIVCDDEDKLDKYEDMLGTYMVKVSQKEISDDDSRIIANVLHNINDFERIGDHAKNLVEVAKEIYDKKIVFSREATEELRVLSNALSEILSLTNKAFANGDMESATRVEPLEQVIDRLTAAIKNGHIRRLQNGNSTMQLGFILTDLLTNFERVSDHCSNVAVTVIETEKGSFLTHEYLNAVKSQKNGSFEDYYNEYSKRFAI